MTGPCARGSSWTCCAAASPPRRPAASSTSPSTGAATASCSNTTPRPASWSSARTRLKPACDVAGRQDLPGDAGPDVAAPPFARVAERDLLEPDAIVPGHPRDVQVAVDDRGGVEAQVPLARPGGAAPLREQRVAQHPGGRADQWVVRDEHDRQRGILRGEPAFGGFDPGPAPIFNGG